MNTLKLTNDYRHRSLVLGLLSVGLSTPVMVLMYLYAHGVIRMSDSIVLRGLITVASQVWMPLLLLGLFAVIYGIRGLRIRVRPSMKTYLPGMIMGALGITLCILAAVSVAVPVVQAVVETVKLSRPL